MTPTGVADNGGLVVSSTTAAGAAEPAARARPRPRCRWPGSSRARTSTSRPSPSSTDQGELVVARASPRRSGRGSRRPGRVARTRGSVALGREGGGTVLTSAGNPPRWSKLASRDAIASSAAGRSCGVGDLTAVALDAARGSQVGTTCSSSGLVGIFGQAGGTWHLVGPRFSAPVGAGSDEGAAAGRRERRAQRPRGAAQQGPRRASSALASTDGGAWSRSAASRWGPAIASPPPAWNRAAGSSCSSPGRTGPWRSTPSTGPGAAWQSLPSPPPGTATVAVGPGGQVDALAVATTQLTDWRLDAPAGTWSKIGTVTVPIQFGSSS